MRLVIEIIVLALLSGAFGMLVSLLTEWGVDNWRWWAIIIPVWLAAIWLGLEWFLKRHQL